MPPVFGPVISFGLGGTLVEVLRDRAVALPPLNQVLVENLIERTMAARMLKPMRGAPEVNRKELESLLLRVAEMACELPTIVEMDMNPVIASPDGVVAVDARIVVAPHNEAARPYEHMAIHPYPKELVQRVDLSEGAQVMSGSNGIDGADETSEDLNNTFVQPFVAYTTPTAWTVSLRISSRRCSAPSWESCRFRFDITPPGTWWSN